MRLVLFSLLLLSLSHVFAQPSMRASYSIHDSCPDPAKYHIASRTVYITCGDSASYCVADSIVERYDRNGNLTAILFFEPNAQGKMDSSFAHYLAYDNQNRIVRDSGVYDSTWYMKSKIFLVEYDYHQKDCVVMHTNSFGEKSTTYVYYNAHNTVTSKYTVAENGDTTLRMYTHGDTTFTKGYLHMNNAPLLLIDSTVNIAAPHKITWYCSVFANNPAFVCRIDRYFDTEGKIAYTLSYHSGNILSDSTHYTCNKKNQLVSKTRSVFDGLGDSIKLTWQNDYTYNERGQMTEMRVYGESEPGIVYITRWEYNKDGLRIKKTELSQNADEVEKVVEEETWVYEYW